MGGDSGSPRACGVAPLRRFDSGRARTGGGTTLRGPSWEEGRRDEGALHGLRGAAKNSLADRRGLDRVPTPRLRLDSRLSAGAGRLERDACEGAERLFAQEPAAGADAAND